MLGIFICLAFIRFHFLSSIRSVVASVCAPTHIGKDRAREIDLERNHLKTFLSLSLSVSFAIKFVRLLLLLLLVLLQVCAMVVWTGVCCIHVCELSTHFNRGVSIPSQVMARNKSVYRGRVPSTQ